MVVTQMNFETLFQDPEKSYLFLLTDALWQKARGEKKVRFWESGSYLGVFFEKKKHWG